jgi:hypothetical protein
MKEDEVQNKGHRHGDPAYDARANSFPSVHVHHNVGNQERRTCLDYRNKVQQLPLVQLEHNRPRYQGNYLQLLGL